jgi:DNA polymerase-3 subunit delta
MPLIVLHGEDVYSITRAVARIRGDGQFDDVDVVRVDAQSATPRSILMTIGTPGLFAERRLVVVEGLGLVRQGRGGRGKAKAAAEAELSIADVAAATPATTTVVAVLAGHKPDSKYVKEAVKLAARDESISARAYPAPKQRDMPQWLADRAKEQGILVEPPALNRLAARVGDQVSIAGVELEKLCTATGPDGTITTELVEELVTPSAEETVFPLIDAIAGGRRDLAFGLLQKQLAQGGGTEIDLALRVIALLARQFRILLQIRLMQAAGSKRPEIVSTLAIRDFLAERYFNQAKRLSESHLTAAIERLAATDQGMKNGDAGDAELHLLVADLTHARRPS